MRQLAGFGPPEETSKRLKFLLKEGAAVGVAVSVITGIPSGLYPAYKASRIHPIQALRL